MRTHRRTLVFCLALACGMGVSLASPADRIGAFAHRGAAASSPGSSLPRQVGRLETVSIRTTHPYLPETVAGPWTRVLRDAGATYLRLHFSGFDLAEGDWLEVTGANGADARIYTGRGLLGRGAFWAFTVPGDLAVLTLHAARGGGEGIEVDAYGRGVDPILDAPRARAPLGGDRVASLSGPIDIGPEPEPSGLVCGTQDWSDVACYTNNRPVDAYSARGAVLAIDGCCSTTTAFKVSDSGQFMTSYRTSVADLELRLGYQNTECGGNDATDWGTIVGGQVLTSDPALDYTLFTTVGDSSVIPCLQLDRRQPPLGERIFIPQHPWGAPKKIAIWSDLDVSGFCTVDPIPFDNGHLSPPTTEIGYLCDTSEGSLGAPVLSGATHRVVGINHRGACPNSASRMDLIWPQIAGLAESCSNGFACEPVIGDRCNCDGACSLKERRYIERGGICADCWEEPSP